MSARLPDDHPAWKALRPFGHELVRWRDALGALQQRWGKGRLPAPLTAFLERWMPRQAVAAEMPEAFEVRLGDDRLHVEGPLAAVADPRWQALLRLPALRDFWVAELRAAHLAHLLEMVPPVWCMDGAALPPGAVIAGLGIHDWRQLPDLVAAGRRLEVEVLDSGDRLCRETRPASLACRAHYACSGGRIVLTDAWPAF